MQRSALLGALVGAASLGIGVVYPVFASYRALHVGDAQERRRWLAVWLCLTAVGAADSSVGLLLSHSSLYAEAKLLLLLWLILPQTNVSSWTPGRACSLARRTLIPRRALCAPRPTCPTLLPLPLLAAGG